MKQRILLSGCNGRMGQAVSALVEGRDDAVIVAGVDTNAVKRNGYPVYADLQEFGGSADVVIDFSHPSAAPRLLDCCVKRKLPVVLATTGYDDLVQAVIAAASRQIPLFQSANMSLGVSLLMDLAAKAAAVLGESFDVEIVERHHRNKLDAPSGTAVMLYNRIADALPYQPHVASDRNSRRDKRDDREVGMLAVRGGSIVGDHSVIFAGRDEVIEISHSAASREIFAVGAVRAAKFLAGQAPGLYSMQDLVASL